MTGRAHLLLLRECLYSYGRVARKTPKLVILNDGSLQDSEVIQALDFWPSEIEVWTDHHVFTRLAKTSLHDSLRQLAQAHPLGLKLSFILASSMEGRQLFTDSDILWFRDPMDMIENWSCPEGLAIGIEEGCSLNESLAKKYAQELFTATGPNSGLVWSVRDLTTIPALREILETACEKPTHEFNEQTVLGILVSKYGRWLPSSVCLTAFDDAFKFNHCRVWDNGYAARHYVRFMRHQFFRDAISRDGGWFPPFG